MYPFPYFLPFDLKTFPRVSCFLSAYVVLPPEHHSPWDLTPTHVGRYSGFVSISSPFCIAAPLECFYSQVSCLKLLLFIHHLPNGNILFSPSGQKNVFKPCILRFKILFSSLPNCILFLNSSSDLL